MRTETCRNLTVVLLGLALAAPARAAVEDFKIDPAHSAVTFTIRHFLSKVPGSFQKLSGTIAFDASDPGTAKVAAEIDATSISTGNEGREKHLKSPDFFDVEKFPTLTFASTAVVKGSSADSMTLKGDLTMHGVTKPVEVKVTSLGALTDAWGNHRAAFEGTTTINRKDFGITFNKVLDAGSTMLGDEVAVTLNIEAVKKKPEAAKEGEAAAKPKPEGAKAAPAAPAGDHAKPAVKPPTK